MVRLGKSPNKQSQPRIILIGSPRLRRPFPPGTHHVWCQQRQISLNGDVRDGTGFQRRRLWHRTGCVHVALAILQICIPTEDLRSASIVSPLSHTRILVLTAPRAYRKRVGWLASSRFLWPWAVLQADYQGIIKANGLDAYFFVRFLRMMVIVFLPIWVISWAVLLPVNTVGTLMPGRSGLDRFSFGNIQPDKVDRYAAHLILNWLFTGGSMPIFKSLLTVLTPFRLDFI